jgi:DNA polymerase-3 subunit delta'
MPFHSDQLLSQIQTAHSENRLAHAYLLIGQASPPLEQIATSMAHIILKHQSNHPHPDLHILAPTGKARTIKIDQIRTLENEIYLKPLQSQYKVTLILEADRLCQGQAPSANAFLKTLEEPPPHTLFILTTTQPNALLETIRSRCLNIQVHTPPPDPIPEATELIQGWFEPHTPHQLQPYHRARLLQTAIDQILTRITESHTFENHDQETAKALAETAYLHERQRLIHSLIEAYATKLHKPAMNPTDLHYHIQSIQILDRLQQALEIKIDATLAIEHACWQLYRLEKKISLIHTSETLTSSIP